VDFKRGPPFVHSFGIVVDGVAPFLRLKIKNVDLGKLVLIFVPAIKNREHILLIQHFHEKPFANVAVVLVGRGRRYGFLPVAGQRTVYLDQCAIALSQNTDTYSRVIGNRMHVALVQRDGNVLVPGSVDSKHFIHDGDPQQQGVGHEHHVAQPGSLPHVAAV
jgi:hypothetical protein